MWIQAILARRGAGVIPAPTPRDVDIRRRAVAARQDFAHTCRRGTRDLARGSGEQAQRRAGLAADATRFVDPSREPAARTVGHGQGWEAKGGLRGVRDAL